MKKLKRFSIFMLVAILLFSIFFSACGTAENQSGSTGGTDSIIDTTSIPNEKYESKIYTLAQAYEEGKITREHLLNIAYYTGSAEYNKDEINESFTPIVHAELTDKISLQIRSVLADMYEEKYGFTDTADDFIITNFYGYYNSCIAFYYKNLNIAEADVILPYSEVIDNITFIRPVYIFF